MTFTVAKDEWYPVFTLLWNQRYGDVVEATYDDWVDWQILENIYQAMQGRLYDLLRDRL